MNDEAVRLPLAKNFEQHGGEPIDGVSLEAFGIVEGWKGKKGTVDIRAPVDQIERLGF